MKNIEADTIASEIESSNEDNEEELLSKIAKREESWKCFDSIATTTTSSSSSETCDVTMEQFEKYLREPLEERLSDPIIWWKHQQFMFLDLANISKQYLSAPASSVYSERFFSEIGNIYEDKRARLTRD